MSVKWRLATSVRGAMRNARCAVGDRPVAMVDTREEAMRWEALRSSTSCENKETQRARVDAACPSAKIPSTTMERLRWT